MAHELPTWITDDPSDGFTREPDPALTHPDLVVALSHEPENNLIKARVYGGAVPASMDEYVTTLEARPATVAAVAASLRERWIKELVEFEPVDPDGVPAPGRAELPYATRLDLSAEPEEELYEILEELVAQGSHLLFDVLLGGEAKRTRRLRRVLLDALRQDGPLRVRFNSDIPLPWPMLCLPEDRGRTLPTAAREAVAGLFGRFVGYRHQTEQTGPYTWIFDEADEKPRPTPEVPCVSLNHDPGIDPDGRTRAAEVAALLADGTAFVERVSRREFLDALRAGSLDEQLMYFWCHGAFATGPDNSRHLVVRLGDGKDIDARTILARHDPSQTTPLLQRRPLVLLNACYAGLADSGDIAQLGGALLRTGAAGVLGPQIRIPQIFAAEYAHAFVTRYLDGRRTAGEITHTLAREFADHHRNPLGLAYALHYGMDNRLRRS
ncbi:CHAT domain-containing protein [Streptomyces sp. NPDC047072]|uniref:CHAT domain-containing protein n=1 Tax=Streptomyces sp. NPDC047072 TaxID=3154809 RepID=UPI0033C01D46